MRILRVLGYLVGTTVVYAACSAAHQDGTAGGGAAAGMSDGAGTKATGPTPTASAGEPPATGGSRIKAKMLVATDGAREWRGWHDSELNEDCYFSKAEDGKLRCLPSATQATYFADAACTRPAYVTVKASASGATSCTTAPVPSTLVLSTPCTSSLTRYAVSAAPGTADLYQVLGATCATVAPTTVAIFDVFALTDATPLPASMFVAATETLE